MCAILLWYAFYDCVQYENILNFANRIYLNYSTVDRQKKHRPNVRRNHSMVRAHGKLVGKTYLVRRLVGKAMLVGKTLWVGKEYVGRQFYMHGVEPLVGKSMSVGKTLCRPDLWWPTLSVGKTNPRPTFCWRKLLSQPTYQLGFLMLWCSGGRQLVV
jgi:hypothetical protein